MRRHAGASTGATSGSSNEADGTRGTAVLLQHPPRCPSTSDSIRETGIHARWSSSRSYAASITVTSRVTRQSASTFSSREDRERPHLLSGEGRKNLG